MKKNGKIQMFWSLLLETEIENQFKKSKDHGLITLFINGLCRAFSCPVHWLTQICYTCIDHAKVILLKGSSWLLRFYCSLVMPLVVVNRDQLTCYAYIMAVSLIRASPSHIYISKTLLALRYCGSIQLVCSLSNIQRGNTFTISKSYRLITSSLKWKIM